jgi:hypothetical protein
MGTVELEPVVKWYKESRGGRRVSINNDWHVFQSYQDGPSTNLPSGWRGADGSFKHESLSDTYFKFPIPFMANAPTSENDSGRMQVEFGPRHHFLARRAWFRIGDLGHHRNEYEDRQMRGLKDMIVILIVDDDLHYVGF